MILNEKNILKTISISIYFIIFISRIINNLETVELHILNRVSLNYSKHCFVSEFQDIR